MATFQKEAFQAIRKEIESVWEYINRMQPYPGANLGLAGGDHTKAMQLTRTYLSGLYAAENALYRIKLARYHDRQDRLAS